MGHVNLLVARKGKDIQSQASQGREREGRGRKMSFPFASLLPWSPCEPLDARI